MSPSLGIERFSAASFRPVTTLAEPFHIRIGQFISLFKNDSRLDAKETVAGTDEEIRDQTFIQDRMVLSQSLRDRFALNVESLFKIGEKLGFFETYKTELELLTRLGWHPFPSGASDTPEPKKFFPYRDAKTNVLTSGVEDDFSNVQRQAFTSAILLHTLLDLYTDHSPFTDEVKKNVIGDAILLKALKPFEILDRIGMKKAAITDVTGDKHDRIKAVSQSLVRDKIIEQKEADRLVIITTHTAGVEGFNPFLQIDQNRQVHISGDPYLQILRAIDDVTIVLLDSPESLTFSTPADKIVMLSGRRGVGLLDQVIILQDSLSESADKNRLTFEHPNGVRDGKQVLGTAAQGQDMISSSIWAHMLHSIGFQGSLTDFLDAIKNNIDTLRG